MPAETFKLPGSSYQEVCRIIQAFGRHNEPVSNDEVAKIAAVHTTIVSRNNAFLAAVGVIEGGKRKVLTDDGRSLAAALEHEMPDKIRAQWRARVDATPFLQNLLAAVRIRKGMDEATALSHVAYTAGAAKSAATKTGAATIVEILKAAELVTEQDGKLIADSRAQNADDSSPVLPASGVGAAVMVAVPSSAVAVSVPMTSQPAISISIQVSVTCSPEELDGLGPRLRRVVQEALNDATAADESAE